MRRMRWWDVAAVAELEQELFPDDPWSAEQLWGELAHVPATRWYVVHEDADGVDGYVGLYAVPPEADVQTIGVAPRSQGRGLGRALLDALVEEAARRGCTQLFLEVRVDNEAALRLYERAGFEHSGRRTGYYGPGVDALVLRRRISAAADEDVEPSGVRP
jgi:ribosomal-protein-alanine N-acetyltransferase